MEPLHRSLGACLGLPSFAYFWKHFPTVISERNGILVCFEYGTYLGYTASQRPSQTGFSFRGSCCVQSWESSLLQLLFSFFPPSFFVSSPLQESEVCLTPMHLVAAHSRNCILVSASERVWSTANDHKRAARDWTWTRLRRNKPCNAQLLWQSIKTFQSFYLHYYCSALQKDVTFIALSVVIIFFTLQIIFFCYFSSGFFFFFSPFWRGGVLFWFLIIV